jgi:uncharacterized protein (DUF1330 family)
MLIFLAGIGAEQEGDGKIVEEGNFIGQCDYAYGKIKKLLALQGTTMNDVVPPVTTLEGTPPKRIVIQAWDSLDQIKAWFNSAAYQEARKIGNKYATFRRFAIEGKAN